MSAWFVIPQIRLQVQDQLKKEMKQILIQSYPALSIVIMLLIRMKLSAKQLKSEKSSGSEHDEDIF